MSSIRFLPLGPLGRRDLEELVARVSRGVAVPCRVVDQPALIELPYLPGRDQVDADALLRHLEAAASSTDDVLVGLTPLDLALPIFTFVFGLARLGGRAAAVSVARLDPAFYGLAEDEELRFARAVNELLHELGHLASLAHCLQAACLMRFAGSVERADARGSAFCDDCLARLPGWLNRPRWP